MTDLVTGEAVPLEMRLAKFPSRVLAIIIDLILLFVLAMGVTAIAGALAPELDEAMAAALVLTLAVGLLVGVPAGVETLTRGRSLGKLALGLRVVRDDGGPIRFRHALVRGLAGLFVDFYVTFGVGAVVCSLLNERGKRVGDFLAGTVVVRERTPTRGGPSPPMPPQLADWATRLELSRLPDELALVARGFLARSYQLSPQVRERIGASLATDMSRVVTPPAPRGTPASAYLAAILAERGRREAFRLAAQHAGHPDGLAASPAPPVAPRDQQSAVRAEPPTVPDDRRGQRFTPPS